MKFNNRIANNTTQKITIMRRLQLPSSLARCRFLPAAASVQRPVYQLHSRRNFSSPTAAEDLFDQMEATGPLVQREDLIKHQRLPEEQEPTHHNHHLYQNPPHQPSSSPVTIITLFNNFSPSELEQIQSLPKQRSEFLSTKIETLTSIAAERREQGMRDPELEKLHGVGSSPEWLEMNKNDNSASGECTEQRQSIGEHDSGSKHPSQNPLVQLISESNSFSKTYELLQRQLKFMKKTNEGNTNDLYTLADLDLLFSTAMQSVLCNSRSPTEARQALEFVKLFSTEQMELMTMTKNKQQQQQPESSSSSVSPLVWMTAVQAASLALVTPELFSRLLDEALSQLDTCGSDFISNVLSEHQLSSFYTSALSWCSSQFDIETSMKVWSHSLKTFSVSSSTSSSSTSSSSSSILRIAALVIKSTNELVEASSAEAINSSSAFNIGRIAPAVSKYSSSISNSASKYDGGVRNSMFNLFAKSDVLLTREGENCLFNELSWSNFEAILSCFDSETQVKLMKLRMVKKQKVQEGNKDVDRNSKSTDGSNSKKEENGEDESLRHSLQLLELLKRLVTAADIASCEDVSKVILSTSPSERMSIEARQTLSNIQEQTVKLMMSLYCEILLPADFDSALAIFTKFCRGDGGNIKFPVTSEHYTILLRAADGPEDATSLFLDACAAGVVLDSVAYRYLFQKEGRTPSFSRLRQSWDFKKVLAAHHQNVGTASYNDDFSGSSEKMARLDASGVIPALPLGADAHALRLKELEKNEVGWDGQVRRVIST